MNKVLLILLFMTGQILSQNFSNGFNFNLPWNDSTSQEFLPNFPITKIEDFISINTSGNFSLNNEPIRFWGSNIVSDAAFPEKTLASAIAGRLRKMGFNLIRMHHIDNPWSDGSLFDQWDNTRNINPVTLDKLEYLIYHLKNNGIYINMNLNVSRTFKNDDGVENADSLVDFAKGITIFDPVLIALQKEYASKLLTHVNPYTNKSLADDPIMAMVEVINENSLYRMWRENKLRLFKEGGVLTLSHKLMLDSLWNNYLKDKYSSTQNLASIWNAGSTSGSNNNQVINGNFESSSSSWILEAQQGAAAQQTRDIVNPFSGNASAKVTVTKVTGTSWHLQWKQIGLKMIKDSTYKVEFAVRGEKSGLINATVMSENSPWTNYSSKDFNITDTWQVFSFTFKASESNNNTRLSFAFNNTTGNYWFDDIRLGIAGRKGLLPEELLETQTILRLNYDDLVGFTDARAMDHSAFYIKLQDDFYADMKNYLINLGVKVPIVGTNWNIGPGDLASQATMDYIDTHAYWDHPSFPGVPWSSTDWNISNQPMVTSKTGMSIADVFAGTPSLGKPFTISEINSCFPNRYQTESLIFVTAYSAFHNTDGIMFFDYNGSAQWGNDRIDSYFSIHRNPAMMSLMPSCAYAFRNNMISQAKEIIRLNYTRDFINLLPKYGSSWQPELYPKKAALIHGIRNESFNSTATTDFSTLKEPGNPYKSDTGEIIWDNNGIVTVNTQEFIGVSGLLQNYQGKKTGALQLVNAEDFATITWVSLTGDSITVSDKSLITISTVAQNTGMQWDGNTTFHNNWGSRPTQMKPVSLRMMLNIYADSILVYPLDASGIKKAGAVQKYFPSDDNLFDVTIDQNQSKSLWFGIEKFGDGSLTSVDNNGRIDHFKLEQNYPNPFNNETSIEYSVPQRTRIRLSVYDILGKEIAVLFNGIKEQGKYSASWNGRNDSDNLSSSGVFFLRMVSEEFNQVRKIIMLK